MGDELRARTVERKWSFTNVHISREVTVTYGQLSDGSWYARFNAGPPRPFVDAGRALQAARLMMSNYLAAQQARPYLGGGPGVGEWVEVTPV